MALHGTQPPTIRDQPLNLYVIERSALVIGVALDNNYTRATQEVLRATLNTILGSIGYSFTVNITLRKADTFDNRRC